MPTNLELKARYSSVAHAEHIARRLRARFVGILRQTDTYFRVPAGRLKLREINGKIFELISYRRPNIRSSRYSHYDVYPVELPHSLKRMFFFLFGTLVVVSKTRRLYLYRNARIHIDRVRGLGTFVEFEVQVKHGKRQARRLMRELIKAFSIPRHSTVGLSYSDLLLKKTAR